MINAVGLQGPGIERVARARPARISRRAGARRRRRSGDAASTTTRRAAELLARRRAEVVAVEVNLSCPNLEGRRVDLRPRPRAVGRGDRGHGRLRAAAVGEAQPEHRSHRRRRAAPCATPAPMRSRSSTRCSGWCSTRGRCDPRSPPAAVGYSGPADPPRRRARRVRRPAALPDLPIVGVGGVTTGWEAAELMLAGASAVQVGTATFADPAARIAASWPLGGRTASVAALTGHASR